MAQRPAGAGGADAARHPGHGLDRPAARVHRERRCLVHGQGVLAVARAARPGRAAGRRRRAPVRRHRPPGVRRGGHPGRAAPDARPGHRAAVGAAGGHLRAGPRPRHRAGRGLPQGLPAGRAGTGERGVHEQALPRRRPAEGRRGRALPLRPRAGLPRRAVRRPPQAVPADHRGRHRRDHAVLRHAGRARDRRGEDRGGRLRLQPPGRHRAAARAARLRRGGRHRLGARQRQPRRRPGAAGARLGRRAPRPARSDGAHPACRRGPVRRRGVRRHPARPGPAGPGQRGARGRVGAAAAGGEVPARALRQPVRRRGRGGSHGGSPGLPRRGVRRAGPVGDAAAERHRSQPRRAAPAPGTAHLRRERLARGGGRPWRAGASGPRTPTSRWCG